MAKRGASPWDLTALLNAADPKASLAERHLWIIRLLEWLRHAPVAGEARATAPGALDAAPPDSRSQRCACVTCSASSSAMPSTASASARC